MPEVPVPGPIPRFEIPGWRQRYGVVAGITGRGNEPAGDSIWGSGADAPVGEVMSRWRAFRRAMPGFNAVVLGNQVHGVEVRTRRTRRGWIQIEGVDGWVSTAARGPAHRHRRGLRSGLSRRCRGRGVALLHAGWRGTAGGILGRGVERAAGGHRRLGSRCRNALWCWHLRGLL